MSVCWIILHRGWEAFEAIADPYMYSIPHVPFN